jgi:hypothetical protein
LKDHNTKASWGRDIRRWDPFPGSTLIPMSIREGDENPERKGKEIQNDQPSLL